MEDAALILGSSDDHCCTMASIHCNDWQCPPDYEHTVKPLAHILLAHIP
eukprot:COSAG05_NODE_1198_length_5555_cov_3.672287_13_plen_49_part_00